MAFILSASTEVGFGLAFSKTRGISSVQVTSIPQVQRLPVMGTSAPFSEVKQTQTQVTLTCYPPGPLYDLPPSMTCKDANTIKFRFSPKGCGTEVFTIQGEFFVNSYSFEKETNRLGQETWGLIDKPVTVFARGAKYGSERKVMVRGISEAQVTPNINTGVVLDPQGRSFGYSSSITSGNPGVGRANITVLGVATRVGGATSSKGSEDGKAQVQIPYQVVDI